jgi:hypothetical protein
MIVAYGTSGHHQHSLRHFLYSRCRGHDLNASNHLTWLLEVGAGSTLLGLGGFGALLASGPPEPVPDMPIREVFFYLDHDVLKTKPDRWDIVGRNLLDRLSTGRLKAWGRQIGRGSPHSRTRAPQGAPGPN